jgi:hypothetical protein
MKHFGLLSAALFLAGSLAGGAHAASMNRASGTNWQSPWLGTWSCNADGEKRTMAFSSMLGGSAMRITETGRMPIEEMVTFDAKRRKFINQHMQAAGGYATMEGMQHGKAIVFSQVYPARGPVLTVTRTSENTFTSAFAATMNGKRISSNETCTKT